MRTYLPADAIELVLSGSDYFDRLVQLLDNAQESVHFQTYIFEPDSTGMLVANALKRAAARGVQVWLMVDRFGSQNLTDATVVDLMKSGISFRFFRQYISYRKWYFGRTLHQKVVVVDARHALIGGINVADKYHGSEKEEAWFDLAVYIRGTACTQLYQLCTDVFQHQYWKNRFREKGRTRLLPPDDREGMVRFRLNDWVRRKTEIYQSYSKGISAARETLYLVASYFLPGRSVRRRLKAAAKRGVEVRVLLSGPSDVRLSHLAERFLVNWMHRRGIRVFRWERSVMHGKAMLVDGQWSTLGSYNVNRLSRFRSLEFNVDIADPEFNRHFGQRLEEIMQWHCTEITPENNPEFTGFWNRWKARLAYHFSVYLMRVLFPERR